MECAVSISIYFCHSGTLMCKWEMTEISNFMLVEKHENCSSQTFHCPNEAFVS